MVSGLEKLIIVHRIVLYPALYTLSSPYIVCMECYFILGEIFTLTTNFGASSSSYIGKVVKLVDPKR